MYFTGRRHAGENLNEVIRQRAADHPPPLQMRDALSRNYPQEFRTIVAKCLAHARRKFIEIKGNFLDECARELNALAAVYAVDAQARDKNYSP